MPRNDRPLVWLRGEIKTPPLSTDARVEAGLLLRRVQRGERLEMPYCRPMTTIGARCHELRIQDVGATWRVIYRVDRDAIVICEVFAKKSQATPRTVIDTCRRRLAAYDATTAGKR